MDSCKRGRRIAPLIFLGSAWLSGAQAAPVYDAIAEFNQGAGSNNAGAAWQYFSTKGKPGTHSLSLMGQYLPGNASAHVYDGVPLATGTYTVPAGESHRWWQGNTSYAGRVTLDTGFVTNGKVSPYHVPDEGTLVTGIYFSPGYLVPGFPNPSLLAPNLVMGFNPGVSEATTFHFEFDVASSFDINGSQDCKRDGSNCPGPGHLLGLFLNGDQLAADSFWTEDGDALNGAKRASDEWIYLNPQFARYDAPITMAFDLLMNPGDMLYLTVTPNGDYRYDGLLMTGATATALDATGGTVPLPAPYALLLAGIAWLGSGRRRQAVRAAPAPCDSH